MKRVDPRRLVPLVVLAFGLSCTGTMGALPSDLSGPGDRPDGSQECEDGDDDGYGPGCSAGADCDDGDPAHHDDCAQCLEGPATGCPCEASEPIGCYGGDESTRGVGACREGERRCVDGAWSSCEGEVLPTLTEMCNEIDDDCDGEVDEAVTGECGACDPSCAVDSLGVGGESAWDPREDNSEAVGVDEESGGLVLDAVSVNTSLIWVPNTGEGTVSKIDIRTFAQLGRYPTGYDPSRTSVNTLGDVYVGNRQGLSVTKISALGDRCPDTNGDGVITTSHGGDVLAWGQDDCVLWRTELTGCGWIRAVAAQDEYGPDGEIHPYVWVGGWDGCVWKLDGETGAIVVNRTPAPVNPYGFALDGSGNLWIESGGGLGRIDTARCRDDASCAVEVCDDSGDDCVKQRITQPVGGYGITVDFMQRVWIGGSVARYDPSLEPGSRWTVVNPGQFVHGVTADGEGWVWAASMDRVYRINADVPSEFVQVAGASGYSAKGAAVDADGKIWIINQSHNCATVITPGEGIDDAEVTTNVAPVFSSPYVYSDMTGSQLRFATNNRGFYRALFEGCDDGDTLWGELLFDAFAPDGTSVLFRARTADDPSLLEEAEWVTLATVPDDESPVSVAGALEAASVAAGSVLELEVQLTTDRTDSSVRLTPVVYSVAISHTCEAPLT